MTLTRARSGNWANYTNPAVPPTANQQLSPAELNHIDLNLTRALDGTGGGPYSLLSELTLNGVGVSIVGDGLLQSRITGPTTLAATTSSIVWRTQLLLNTNQTITTSADVFYFLSPGSDVLLGLGITDEPLFQTLWVFRNGAGAGAIKIGAEGSNISVDYIARLDALTHCGARFLYMGFGDWEVLEYSPGVTVT